LSGPLIILTGLIMNDLSESAELFYFASALTLSTWGVVLFYRFPESRIIGKWAKIKKGETSDILFRRLIGIFIYGILPFLILLPSGNKSLADFGINPPTLETFIWTILLSVIILPLNYFNSFKAENLQKYPQIRESGWSFSLLAISCLSWMAYLFSFEFLFRGFLFFASIPLFGLGLSIILNTIIYSLAHLPKGFKETIGAIPFGILLCYLTYRTNSIWIAVFSHIVLALSCEWFSIRAHPQMFLTIKLK